MAEYSEKKNRGAQKLGRVYKRKVLYSYLATIRDLDKVDMKTKKTTIDRALDNSHDQSELQFSY